MKDIKGYAGRYQINENGKIKDVLKNRYLKINYNNWGYLCVNLPYNRINKSLTIHRLIALHFIPNPHNKPQVNHIDGIKSNNNISNLEWVTHKENAHHAFSIGRGGPQKPVTLINENGDSKYYHSRRKASLDIGRHKTYVERAIRWGTPITNLKGELYQSI